MSNYNNYNEYDIISFDKILHTIGNNRKVNLDLPKYSRMIILGGSGSGKTTASLNIIRQYFRQSQKDNTPTPKIYYIVKNKNEDKYQALNDMLGNDSDNDDEPNSLFDKDFYITSNLELIPNINDIPNEKIGENHYIIIFDDLTGEDNKTMKKIGDLFKGARKQNITTIFIAHDWSALPKMIRNNANFLCIFPFPNMKIMRGIRDTYSALINPEKFEKAYKSICNNPHDFLTLDLYPPSEILKIRKGFRDLFL